VKKIKKSEKVKKVKKSEKVKPKVNHFLKASETPKCTFPSPLVDEVKAATGCKIIVSTDLINMQQI